MTRPSAVALVFVKDALIAKRALIAYTLCASVFVADVVEDAAGVLFILPAHDGFVVFIELLFIYSEASQRQYETVCNNCKFISHLVFTSKDDTQV